MIQSLTHPLTIFSSFFHHRNNIKPSFHIIFSEIDKQDSSDSALRQVVPRVYLTKWGLFSESTLGLGRPIPPVAQSTRGRQSFGAWRWTLGTEPLLVFSYRRSRDCNFLDLDFLTSSIQTSQFTTYLLTCSSTDPYDTNLLLSTLPRAINTSSHFH